MTRGPAPKPNAIARGRGVKVRHEPTAPTEPLPIPDGYWYPGAVRWWNRMTTSPTAALWDSPADLDQLERGLAHADMFWRAVEDGDYRTMAAAETILIRIETVLWLNRAERARQGIQAETKEKAAKAKPGAASRARLRAVGDALD